MRNHLKVCFQGNRDAQPSKRRHSEVLLAEFRVEGQSYDCLDSSGCSNNASVMGGQIPHIPANLHTMTIPTPEGVELLSFH